MPPVPAVDIFSYCWDNKGVNDKLHKLIIRLDSANLLEDWLISLFFECSSLLTGSEDKCISGDPDKRTYKAWNLETTCANKTCTQKSCCTFCRAHHKETWWMDRDAVVAHSFYSLGWKKLHNEWPGPGCRTGRARCIPHSPSKGNPHNHQKTQNLRKDVYVRFMLYPDFILTKIWLFSFHFFLLSCSSLFCSF